MTQQIHLNYVRHKEMLKNENVVINNLYNLVNHSITRDLRKKRCS